MLPRLSAAALALCLAGLPLHSHAQSAPAATRTAPAADCLDARTLAEIRQPDARTLSIATTDKHYYLLGLGQDCPGVEADADTTLWGREGWICGGGRDFLRAGGRDCAIATSRQQDVAEHARQSRLADSNGPRTLAPVQVRGGQRPGQHGFRGTTSYCFAPRYMRAWSEDPQGVVVEVSPVHSGGNRYYRVELNDSCPMLGHSSEISFVSGMDIGIICGNAGDMLVVERDLPGTQRRVDHPMFSRPGRAPLIGGARCGVAAVYPRP